MVYKLNTDLDMGMRGIIIRGQRRFTVLQNKKTKYPQGVLTWVHRHHSVLASHHHREVLLDAVCGGTLPGEVVQVAELWEVEKSADFVHLRGSQAAPGPRKLTQHVVWCHPLQAKGSPIAINRSSLQCPGS